jgi:hypothetical protein
MNISKVHTAYTFKAKMETEDAPTRRWISNTLQLSHTPDAVLFIVTTGRVPVLNNLIFTFSGPYS